MQSTGRAIATNHAERAFPSCVETTRWWRISKNLWRDVSECCSSAKTQGWFYALKICSESKRKYTTGKYEIEPARRKLSKVAKNELKNRCDFVIFIFAKTKLEALKIQQFILYNFENISTVMSEI